MFLTTTWYSTRLPDARSGDFAFGVRAHAGDALELFDREVGFLFDVDFDLVRAFRQGEAQAHRRSTGDRRLVRVFADRVVGVFAGVGGSFAEPQFGFAGTTFYVFAVAVDEFAEFQRHVARVFDDDLVVDYFPEFGFEFAFGVGGFAGDLLFLGQREGRFGWDVHLDRVGALFTGPFVAFDRGFVGVDPDRAQRVLAGDRRGFERRQFFARDVFGFFAVRVLEVRERQRFVARVFDDDVVFDDLPDFGVEFFGRVARFARDPLFLFDREGGVTGSDAGQALFGRAALADDFVGVPGRAGLDQVFARGGDFDGDFGFRDRAEEARGRFVVVDDFPGDLDLLVDRVGDPFGEAQVEERDFGAREFDDHVLGGGFTRLGATGEYGAEGRDQRDEEGQPAGTYARARGTGWAAPRAGSAGSIRHPTNVPLISTSHVAPSPHLVLSGSSLPSQRARGRVRAPHCPPTSQEDGG